MTEHTHPEPPISTLEAIDRAAMSERDFVIGQIKILDTRLDAMDEAAKVLNETVTRVPTDVQREVSNLRNVLMEKFRSVDERFKWIEKGRLEQKSDSKTNLDAALAAASNAVNEQNKSNTLAISKSEKATSETIKTNQELFKTTTDAMSDNMSDLKTRIEKIEARKEGNTESRTGLYAAIAAVGVAVAIVVSIANAVFK